MIVDDVKTWLLGEGFDGAIAVKPDDVADTSPYWVLTVPTSQVDGSIGEPDSERHPLMQVKSVGNSTEQALALHGRMVDRLLSYTGDAIQLVVLENENGPHRDDERYPGPHAFYTVALARIRTTDN